MPHEIKTFAFEGHALTFSRRDGSPEWWANGDEAAEALGYEDKRKVANLFKRHAEEFLETETCVLTLRTEGDKQARAVRLYSPRGLEHLAMLGRTDTCRRFRRWVLDVIDQLRTGARVVTEDQMREAIRMAVDAVVAQYAGQIGHLSSSLSAVARVAEVQASNAGRLLSLMSRDPEVRRVLEEERDRRSGQTKIPFPDGPVLPGPGSDARNSVEGA